MTIAKWMDDLELLCVNKEHMTIFDLSEASVRTAYNGGFTPEQFLVENTFKTTWVPLLEFPVKLDCANGSLLAPRDIK